MLYFSSFSHSETTLQIFLILNRIFPVSGSPYTIWGWMCGVLGISRCYLTHRRYRTGVAELSSSEDKISSTQLPGPGIHPISSSLCVSFMWFFRVPSWTYFKVTLVTMRKQCTDSIECELSCVDKMGDRALEFNQYLHHCVSSEYLLDTLEIHTGYNVKAMWAVLRG